MKLLFLLFCFGQLSPASKIGKHQQLKKFLFQDYDKTLKPEGLVIVEFTSDPLKVDLMPEQEVRFPSFFYRMLLI